MDENHPDFTIEKAKLKEYCKRYRNLKNKIKRDYYNNLFNRHKNDIKKTWESINQVLGRNLNKSNYPESFKINGEAVNIENAVHHFNNFFTDIGPNLSNSIPQNENIDFKTFLGPSTDNNLYEFIEIGCDEVANTIQSLPSKRSSGRDGLSSILIKQLKDQLVQPLTFLINQSIRESIFPNDLKIAKVIPLFKKGDKELIDNYRPISLLPVISKIYERVLFNQLMTIFTGNDLFHGSQYGYRSNHSTQLAALELVDRVTKALESKDSEHSLAVFMDLSKAFDTIDHEILLQKLSHYGLGPKSLLLLRSYLSDRKQFVSINGFESDLRNISTGVPQGSILGPLLFIMIYIRPVPMLTPSAMLMTPLFSLTSKDFLMNLRILILKLL